MTPLHARPFTPDTLAERWGCSGATIRNLCRDGKLAHFRVGKEYRIPQHIVERFEQELPKAPTTDRRYVYFIRAKTGGLIKIGIAEDPLVRLVNMQAVCPVQLRVLGCLYGGRALERALHLQFKDDRQHFEWFSPTTGLRAFVEVALAIAGVPRAIYEAKGNIYRSAAVQRLADAPDA